MSQKHQRTLEAVFKDPVRSNIPWRDIEALLVAEGAEISEGAGSRIRVALNGIRAVFHRPHPQKETDKGAVRSVRKFLRVCPESAGDCPYFARKSIHCDDSDRKMGTVPLSDALSGQTLTEAGVTP